MTLWQQLTQRTRTSVAARSPTPSHPLEPGQAAGPASDREAHPVHRRGAEPSPRLLQVC